MRASELERRLRAVLEGPERTPDDLRQILESHASQRSFSGLVWLWGPALYARHGVVFRPFILAHFGTIQVDEDGETWIPVPWKGEPGRALAAWLAQVDRDDDVEIFKHLYAWKLGSLPSRERARAFCAQLSERFGQASSPATRRSVLARFDLGYALDEATALGLYRADPELARPFILNHLGFSWTWRGVQRKPWEKLWEEAGRRGDADFRDTLYRKQVPLDRWVRDALALCASIEDPSRLCQALDRQSPDGFGFDLADGLRSLLERRGRDVLPYALKQLRHVRGGRVWLRRGFDRLLALARARGWHDLWAALLRVSASRQEFNREIVRLLDDPSVQASDVPGRLLLLIGIGRALALPPATGAGHCLDDATALKLYEREPALLRGALCSFLGWGWSNDGYPRLVERVLASGDDILADALASRLLTRVKGGGLSGLPPSIDALSRHYEGVLRTDEAAFSRRACAVLTRLPARSIYRYAPLIRENRLARLFFERSDASLLTCPQGLRDLVEAPEIHVQALAYRALGASDPRAKEVASACIDVLLGTLLRPLHRTTRLRAFAALLSAAGSLENAMRIHARAREALDLRERWYPREQLIGLIGRLLHGFPQLRGPAEEPRVFGGGRA